MCLIMFILISIAFFTLMDRKFLSYSQNRKGPYKTILLGIFQPISDAIKLFSKELNLNIKSNFEIFFLTPCLNLILSLFLWSVYPFMFNFNFMKFSLLMFFCISSSNIVIIMLSSWSSNSNHSILGMMRTIAQMISYEISLMITVVSIITMTEQLNLNMMKNLQMMSPLMITIWPIFIIWMTSILAETNRTPFDFSEGESELVSGFNIEYSSKSFAFLFLAEYSNILIVSFMTITLFLNLMPNFVMFMLMFITLCFFFIWIRTTLPRFRYDKLMSLSWKIFLPLSLMFIMLSFSMKLYYTKKNGKVKEP